MKKLIVLASVVGLAAGVIYLLCKKGTSNTTVSEPAENKVDVENTPQQEDIFQQSNAAEELHQAKGECVQAVYSRHSEAGEIMKDAYQSIMEDFVQDFSGEKVADEKDIIDEVVVDQQSDSIIKELDALSDELDDLLK